MSERDVDRDDLRHLATLARIDLDEDRIDTYLEDCLEILAYFDRLEDVPDSDTEPTVTNVFRDDRVADSLPQEKALENASSEEDGYFRGPPVS